MATDWEGTAVAYDKSFARLTAGTVQPMLSALLERRPRPRILLDVGTGTGNVAAAAAELGIETQGVDADRSMIALGSVPDFPYPDEHFHAVTANFVINHVTEPVASIRELRRVVAPGGPVGVTIWPAPVNAMNRLWNDVIEMSGATIGHTYRAQIAEARERMSDAFLSLTAGMTGPDGELHLPSTAILGVAN